MLRQSLSDALKEALVSKDKTKTSTLRLILAAIKDKDIAERTKGEGNPISDTAILQLLQTMIKQRQDSIDMYKKGGRQDLALKEGEEVEVIKEFLPQQLSEEEMRQVVAKLIDDKGAKEPKDMGLIMGALKSEYAGKMDFSVASRIVKELLTSNG